MTRRGIVRALARRAVLVPHASRPFSMCPPRSANSTYRDGRPRSPSRDRGHGEMRERPPSESRSHAPMSTTSLAMESRRAAARVRIGEHQSVRGPHLPYRAMTLWIPPLPWQLWVNERWSPWPLPISALRSGNGRPRPHKHPSGGAPDLTVPEVRRQHPQRGDQDPLRMLLPHRPPAPTLPDRQLAQAPPQSDVAYPAETVAVEERPVSSRLIAWRR
jgi:hypothetical protein